MKFLKKILLFFIVLFVLFVVAASFYIKRYGKAMIEEAVGASLKKKFSMANIRYQFPMGFAAEDVDLEKIFRAKNISAQFSLAAIFSRRLDIVYVILKNPVIRVERSTLAPPSERTPSEGTPSAGAPPAEGQPESLPGEKPAGKKFEVFIHRLFVQNGQVQYSLESPGQKYEFALRDLQLKAQQIALPLASIKSNFVLTGRIDKNVTPFAQGQLEASGWFNWPRRDLQAKVKITQPDGNVGLRADAISKNNIMSVNGEINVQNFIAQAVREARPKTEASSSINDLIADSLSSMGVRIGAQFSFQTKMDDFQLNAVSFSGNVSGKEPLPFEINSSPGQKGHSP